MRVPAGEGWRRYALRFVHVADAAGSHAGHPAIEQLDEVKPLVGTTDEIGDTVGDFFSSSKGWRGDGQQKIFGFKTLGGIISTVQRKSCQMFDMLA